MESMRGGTVIRAVFSREGDGCTGCNIKGRRSRARGLFSHGQTGLFKAGISPAAFLCTKAGERRTRW